MEGVDVEEKNLDAEKLGSSVVLENQTGCDSLELSDRKQFQEVENAADIPGQSKLEPFPSDHMEPERPRRVSKCNLRQSLAWDSAFFTSKGVLDPESDDFELFDHGNPLEVENPAELFGQKEQEFLPSDSLEPVIPNRDRRSSLRQSLAWDSAFFTSEGVLDPEELSMINQGLKKVKIHLLPRIEELQRSAESSSTIDCDGASLDSLEIDLFEDIRASIKKSSKPSNLTISNYQLGIGAASKKLDAAPQIRMRTALASRKQSINVNGSERIAREISIQKRAQHAAKSGEAIPSSLKLPKMLGRGNPISAAPTKRVSLGASHAEMENKGAKTTFGKRLVATRKPCLIDSCTVPNSTSSPKSSSGSPIIANKATASCSPDDRSYSASSAATGKSLPNSLRRKIDSGNVNPATSVSTLKTPLRFSTRTKNEIGSSSHSSSRSSSLLSSSQKPSSCTSSTSSFDGWSSESSSSTVNQRSYASNIENDTTKASNIENPPPNQCCVRHKSHTVRLPNQNVKKGSMVNGPGSPDISGSSKPSSLRMPSPKLGFFDMEKSLPTAVGRSLQFQSSVQGTLPKSGAMVGKLSGAASRARRGKLQQARTSIGTQNLKPASQQTGVSCPHSGLNPAYPSLLHKAKDASTKESRSLRTMRSHLEMTGKNQNVSSSKISRENGSKTPDAVGARGNATAGPGWGSNTNAENKGTQGSLKERMRRERKGTVHVRANKNDANEDRLQRSCEITNPRREGSPWDKPRVCKNEKEICLEDQVDGLSRQVKVIDLSRD